jgi:hypothetical protein
VILSYIQASYSCYFFYQFSLGPLVRRIKEAQVLEVIDQLSNFAAQQKNDELRGIASIGKSIGLVQWQIVIIWVLTLENCIGLKTVIVEITPNRASNVCKRIIPRLLQQLENVSLPLNAIGFVLY